MSNMDVLTRIAWDWGVRCFGVAHMTDVRVRAVRMLEEATEAAQAAGVGVVQAQAVVHTVYQRPAGAVAQELGGTLLTTACMCACGNFQPEHLFELELRRVLDKPTEHFTARNQSKLDMGLTG